MGFPSSINVSTLPRVYVARILEGASLPVPITIDSDSSAAAGATSLTLSLTTFDGSAASTESIWLEHDQPILMESNNVVNIDGAGSTGDYFITVDDGSDGVPTGLIAAGDFFTIASDPTLYKVVTRTGITGGYRLKIYPALQGSAADDAAVTVYNKIRLNLATGVQFYNLTTTGVSVPVVGCTYAMDAATTSRDTYVYRQMIGVETSSPEFDISTTDVATNTLRTTLGGETSLAISVEGIRIPGESAIAEVLLPKILPQLGGSRAAESIYVAYESSDGAEEYQGPGSITDASGGEEIDSTPTYSFTLSVNSGDDLRYWRA